MRYEDWTYREAEARLAEHGELRRADGRQLEFPVVLPHSEMLPNKLCEK
jgi:hypothetical protein